MKDLNNNNKNDDKVISAGDVTTEEGDSKGLKKSLFFNVFNKNSNSNYL